MTTGPMRGRGAAVTLASSLLGVRLDLAQHGEVSLSVTIFITKKKVLTEVQNSFENGFRAAQRRPRAGSEPGQSRVRD